MKEAAVLIYYLKKHFKSVKHENILITGGSKGIGKELVKAFVQRGHHVSFTYQYSAESAHNLVASLNAEGFQHIRAFKCDMGNDEEVKALFREQRDILKEVDVLINNAGIRDSKLNAHGSAASS